MLSGLFSKTAGNLPKLSDRKIKVVTAGGVPDKGSEPKQPAPFEKQKVDFRVDDEESKAEAEAEVEEKEE